MKSLKMCWKTNSQKKKFQKDVKKSRANNPNFEYSLDFVACRLATILGLENELDRSTLDDFFEIFLNYEEAIRTIQAKEFRYHKKIIRAYSRNAYKKFEEKVAPNSQNIGSHILWQAVHPFYEKSGVRLNVPRQEICSVFS